MIVLVREFWKGNAFWFFCCMGFEIRSVGKECLSFLVLLRGSDLDLD